MARTLADILETIAHDPDVVTSMRERSVGPLPDGDDAFWLRRASIALYGDASNANAALREIEARRHGKPPERIEHSGGLSIKIDPRELSDEQLAAIVAGAYSAKP